MGIWTFAALALALAGCSATGQGGGERTISRPGVPFSFRVPADFLRAPVDPGDTRGDVPLAAGIDKLDVVALRRTGARALPRGAVAHRVRGRPVRSTLHRVAPGWALECQWTPQRRDRVLAACRTAVATVRRR